MVLSIKGEIMKCEKSLLILGTHPSGVSIRLKNGDKRIYTKSVDVSYSNNKAIIDDGDSVETYPIENIHEFEVFSEKRS